MSSSSKGMASGTVSYVIGGLTWPVLILLTMSGIGSHPSGEELLGGLLFLAPLPLGFRLLASDSSLSGAWLIALTPILGTITFVLATLFSLHAADKYVMMIEVGFLLLWLLPAFYKNFLSGQAEELISEIKRPSIREE